MILVRRLDWKDRLIEFVNQRSQMPYRYGITDCWCFARGSVQVMTDTLLLPEIDPPKGWLEAAKIMIEHNWKSVEDLMDEVVGNRIDPSVSNVGDIVSFSKAGEHLAVRIDDSALTPAKAGLEPVDRQFWLKAWRIG